jgi:hypothetical protein
MAIQGDELSLSVRSDRPWLRLSAPFACSLVPRLAPLGYNNLGTGVVNGVINPHLFGSAGLLHPKLVAPRARDQLDVTVGGQEV